MGQLSKLPGYRPVTECHRGNVILDLNSDWSLWHVIYWESHGRLGTTYWFMREKTKKVLWSDYNGWDCTEVPTPLSTGTQHCRPGRNSPEKRLLCWISGCVLRWVLICVRSSWIVPVVLRPSAPAMATRSSFCLYDERGSKGKIRS